ncbi:MAG: pyridoxal phosphate-dependent aminotransferase [Acidobacteriia bacterium]|nr:pyridoxal phosphate-dependent aminotransferase [Terriglobia bacterium]
MRLRHSDYMHWAKTRSRARFNLATSGVGPYSLRDLPVSIEQIEINGDNGYGYEPLKRAIAGKAGVDPDCVVTAAGTSMANYLAMAALLDPGDEILIERPAYELLISAARYVGAEVKFFDRTEESGYALDPVQVRRALTPKTRLIVVTNLHNPSSALAAEPELQGVVDLARSIGARVLVDEVYLDAVYGNTPRTSFHLGPGVVVTSSLTKIYGLSGLRCGWILADPDLARAMWRLNDLFAATPVHPGELLSVAAFERLDRIREKARRVVEADRAVLSGFLDRHPEIAAARTAWGTTAFLGLRNEDAEPFLDRLRAEYETSAVPGRFFGMPGHFRIGMGVNSEIFAEGLRRIGSAM